MAIEKFEKDMKIIYPLDDYPNDAQGLTSEELKAKFDEGGEALKEYINTVLLPALIARNLGFERSDNVPADTIQEAIENLFGQIRNTAVGTIPNGAVTTEKIADASVTMGKLADDVMLVLNDYGLHIVENADDIDALIISLAQLSLAVEQHIGTANDYFAEHDEKIERRDIDAINSAYQHAQSALAAEHNGTPMLWHDENIKTNLLADKTAVDSFTDLYISGGAGLTPFSGEVSVDTNILLSHASGEMEKIATLPNPNGFGSVDKIVLKSDENDGTPTIELRQNGTVVGTVTYEKYEDTDSSVYDNHHFAVTDFPQLNPYSEYPIEVWGKKVNSSSDDCRVRKVTATYAGIAPTSGYFEKAHGMVSGSRAVLVAKYKGTRPIVSCSVDGNVWQTMTAVKTASSKTNSGDVCTAASFEADFAEYAENAALSLKFELINAGSKVYDYCAAVVR